MSHSFYHDKDVASRLSPQLPEDAFLLRLRRADEVLALVFDQEYAAISQSGDEIRIEAIGEPRKPEGILVTSYVADPDVDLFKTVESNGTLKLLATKVSVDQWNAIRTQRMAVQAHRPGRLRGNRSVDAVVKTYDMCRTRPGERIVVEKY